MNNRIFDEYGNLNIEELIINQPSFIKIMEDGVVNDEEIKEQTIRVENLLHTLEETANDDQIELIRKLLSEMSVLIAIRELKSHQ